MDLKEFSVGLRKARTKKKAKVNGSWGVYDAYKTIRKNGWYDIGRPLGEHEFYSIIRGVNKLFAKELSEGNTFTLPSRMGVLELHKFPTGVSLVDGKLRNTYAINWADTIKLWYEDEEARNNKTLLRRQGEFGFTVRYNKFKANYENRSFYEFALNRFIKKALMDNVQKGKIDSLW